LIGDGCDSLIPSRPPKEAIQRRREDANDRFAGNYVHTVPGTGAKSNSRKPSMEDKRAGAPLKKGKQKQSRRPTGKGYRPKG
jgi:hypothetical protein